MQSGMAGMIAIAKSIFHARYVAVPHAGEERKFWHYLGAGLA
jgi:hypothetical protein